jgi:RNA polymerase sigma-70 factor (ECF subfamily)
VDAVLMVVRLLFNEGYWSHDQATPIRRDLCRLGLELAWSLARLIPADTEVEGLLALLVLHDARVEARLGESGVPVPLPDQDRNRWNRARIEEGVALIEAALAKGQPGPLQIEAAIVALHCKAPSAAETDWQQIASLYELLETMRPSMVVRANRAFAVARAEGPAAGLHALDCDPPEGQCDYPYASLVRGVLLEELGRYDEALVYLESARAGARNAAEVDQLDRRVTECRRRAVPARRADDP